MTMLSHLQGQKLILELKNIISRIWLDDFNYMLLGFLHSSDRLITISYIWFTPGGVSEQFSKILENNSTG